MAISYEDWKTQYEWMSTDQQAKYANMVKWNATAEEYANRYIQEKQNAGTFWQKTAKSYTNANQPVETPTTRQATPVVNNEQPKQTTYDVARNDTTRVDTIKQETPVSTVWEIKQQWALKPLSQDYYNQTSDESQTKIINNLNWYKATNPEYFTDYETFKKNFSYDARNDEQKNTLDVWYKGYTNGLQLSGTPVSDLYTQYKNWSISVWELESLRTANPEKYAELQNQINRGNIIAAYDDDNTTSGTMWGQLRNTWLQNMITNLNTSGSWAGSIFDDYQEKMESPEMTSLGDQATEKQEQIEKVQADIDSIKKTVEAEYEWTWASRAKINAIISDRTYDLQLQLRSLNSEYNKVATQYNNRMTQYQNEFQLQLQEYQFNMQERNQKMSELWFAMDLMNYETPQQKQEREWNYWVRQQEYQNWDINSKDYSTRYKAALKWVENLLAQYPGIPMVRSAEQMAEDVLKWIDAWSTLGAELSNINKLIQQKPEYKKLYDNTYWTGSSVIEDSFKSWNTEWVKYNGSWYTSDEFNKVFWTKWSPKPYDAVDSKVFENNPYASKPYYTLWEFLSENKTQTWKKWGECGKFVNDYLEKIGVWRYFWNEDIRTRETWANTQIPKEWTIAIFDYWHTSSDGINHWHVGIVTKVNNDGSFVVRDSNFDTKNPWVIMERIINPGSTSLKWFFDPSQPPQSSATPSTSWVEWSIAWVPLTFERSVKNLVPAALQNSDAEREALNTVITNAFNGWADEIDVALQFMWFNIRDDKNKDLAMSLVNTIRTLPEIPEWTIKNVSDLINLWQQNKAIQLTENLVSKQAQQANNYISESSVKNALYRSNELSTFLDWLKKKPTWVVQWTMQEWLGKLSSSDAKKLGNYIAQLETSLDIKDKDLANRIIPQLSDQPAVFATKLENLNSNLMQELNWWRDIYWLPTLTEDAVNNFANRIDLYQGNTSVWWQNIVTPTRDTTIKSSISNLQSKYWVK